MVPSNRVTSSLPEKIVRVSNKICSGPPWLICIDIDFMKKIRLTCYSFWHLFSFIIFFILFKIFLSIF